MGSLTSKVARSVAMGFAVLALLMLPTLLNPSDATAHAGNRQYGSRQYSGHQKKKVYPAYSQHKYQSTRYAQTGPKQIKTSHTGKRSYPHQNTVYRKGRGKQSQPIYGYTSKKTYSYPVSHGKKYQTAQYRKGSYPKSSGVKYTKVHDGKRYAPVQHAYQDSKKRTYSVDHGKKYAKYPSKSYRPTHSVKRSYPNNYGYQHQSQYQKQYASGKYGKQYQYQTQKTYTGYHDKKFDRKDYDKQYYPTYHASTYYPSHPVKNFFSVPKAKAFDGKDYDSSYKDYDNYRFTDFDFDKRFSSNRFRFIDGHRKFDFRRGDDLFLCKKLDHNLFLCTKL